MYHFRMMLPYFFGSWEAPRIRGLKEEHADDGVGFGAEKLYKGFGGHTSDSAGKK
jgi:hypothetical protein